jgi:hypothetical protein
MKIGLRTKLQDKNENFVGEIQQIEDGFFVDVFDDAFVDVFDDVFVDVFVDAFRRVLVATVVVVGQRPETNNKIVETNCSPPSSFYLSPDTDTDTDTDTDVPMRPIVPHLLASTSPLILID